MKRKKRHSLKARIIAWGGFSLGLCIAVSLSVYGASRSFSHSFVLESAPSESLALVSVAVANSVGTELPRQKTIPVNLPKDVQGVQDALIRDGQDMVTFFAEHFTRLNTLRELTNIDIVNYLNLHTNRATALEKYTQQLQEKIEEATTAKTTLTQSVELHSSSLTSVRESIKTVQSSIDTLYAQQDGPGIMDTLILLEELRISEQEHSNALIFAKRLSQEYTTLITTASQKSSIIRANTAALVSGVTIHLPAGVGVTELKNLNLFTNDAAQ